MQVSPDPADHAGGGSRTDAGGVDRRAMLRKLAVTGGLVAGSMMVSRPVLADSGSPLCRYDFGGTPLLNYTIDNNAGSTTDFVNLQITNVSGSCGCGGSPVFEYTFDIVISGAPPVNSTWGSGNSVSLSGLVLWSEAVGTATFAGGVRVTCPGSETVPAILCLFGLQEVPVTGLGSFSGDIPLTQSSPQPGLPSCDF